MNEAATLDFDLPYEARDDCGRITFNKAQAGNAQDFREGLDAFLCKRQPRWTGEQSQHTVKTPREKQWAL